MIGKGKKESKSSKQPAASQQYIYQYKIQYIIPNTFSNKESIAQEDSLHNQLKNFISYPLIVWGGRGRGGVINHYPSLMPEIRNVMLVWVIKMIVLLFKSNGWS